MQIISLEVKDGYTQNILAILNGLKDVMLEKIEVKDDPNLEIDPYFYERREELHKLREDIRSGKMEMFDFNESMDELIEELKK